MTGADECQQEMFLERVLELLRPAVSFSVHRVFEKHWPEYVAVIYSVKGGPLLNGT